MKVADFTIPMNSRYVIEGEPRGGWSVIDSEGDGERVETGLTFEDALGRARELSEEAD